MQKLSFETNYLNEMQGIRQSRWRGLSEQIDYYLYLVDEGIKLSQKQIAHLSELANTICAFGAAGMQYYKEAMQIIHS